MDNENQDWEHSSLSYSKGSLNEFDDNRLFRNQVYKGNIPLGILENKNSIYQSISDDETDTELDQYYSGKRW